MNLSKGRSRSYNRLLNMFSGSAVGQAISVLSIPLITSLYSPSSFTPYSSYLAIISLGMVIFSFRLDQVIVITSMDKIEDVLYSANFIGVISTLIVFFVASTYYSIIYGITSGLLFGFLCAVGLYFAGLTSIRYQLSLRVDETRNMAKSKIAFSILTIVFQASLAFFNNGSALIAADIFGRLGSIVPLGMRKLNPGTIRIDVERVRKTVSFNFLFLKYNMITSLISVASLQLPFIIVPLIFKSDEGVFLFALRAISLPIPLISQSISLTLLKDSSEKSEDEMSDFVRVIYTTILVLLLPLAFWSLFYSYNVTTSFFPSKWKDLGIYIGYFSPWAVFWVLSSSFSSVLIYKGKQRQSSFFSVFEFSVRSFSILIAHVLSNSSVILAVTLALGNILIALVALYWFLNLSGINVFRTTFKILPQILLSVSVAIVSKILFPDFSSLQNQISIVMLFLISFSLSVFYFIGGLKK